MIDPSVPTYFQKLKNQSPITIETKNQNDVQHQTLSEHSELNRDLHDSYYKKAQIL